MSSRNLILDKLGMADRVDVPRPEIEIATSDKERVQRFRELAELAVSTTDLVEGVEAVPDAVARYLGDQHLPMSIVTDDFRGISLEAWQRAGIDCGRTAVEADEDIYVSGCYAAISECGAIAVSSRTVRGLGNAFLAATHIVVLPGDRIMPTFETYWQLLRNEYADCRELPREFCFINGPSRTGDLGLPAKLGAHGPGRVHIILLDPEQ
jgi:L-lactate dehydrogenase complex protein LldG